jgi:hypothetical protein
MLSFRSNTRMYLAIGATDLRKSFDTLAGAVRELLRLDLLLGHLLLFTRSRKNRIKILFSATPAGGCAPNVWRLGRWASRNHRAPRSSSPARS